MQELTTPFEQQDLVWAKVQHYPWWPGKIVQIFEQKNTLIFKISFYADPTYCYVKEDALIPFEQFRQQLNASFTIDGQIQRAINLANNAFERKKHALQNRKSISVPKQPIDLEPESQMVQEEASKGEEFEQETIPVDLEGQNSNGKTVRVKKATQIQNLLQKYKLDKIPILPKQTKIVAQEEPSQEGLDSQDEEQEKVELFDIKNANFKKRSIKKKSIKRRPVIKRKPIIPSTNEQRRVHFMRRTCSLIITKGIQAQISRQISIKMMEKVQQAIQKLNDFHTKKMNQEIVYVKLLAIVSDMDGAWPYQEKLVHVFRSVDGVLHQMGMVEKEEQEKTNIIYADEEEISTFC